MENINEKKKYYCPDCGEELRDDEKYICDSCKKMILEYERKKREDEE